MSGDVTPYTGLITSEYANQPKFNATVKLSCQPYADAIAVMSSLPGRFDLDVAVGDQLDKTGEWIGPSRDLAIPVPNVYFSFDIAGQGFDQGVWFGPSNPSNVVLTTLPDEQYRLLLQVTAAANQWDGTIPGMYNTWAVLFSETPGAVKIKDNENGTMTITFTGIPFDALTQAMINSELLLLIPVTVSVTIVFA